MLAMYVSCISINVERQSAIVKQGVGQGECLSPFLFSMYLNDIENIFLEKGLDGINVQHFDFIRR